MAAQQARVKRAQRGGRGPFGPASALPHVLRWSRWPLSHIAPAMYRTRTFFATARPLPPLQRTCPSAPETGGCCPRSPPSARKRWCRGLSTPISHWASTRASPQSRGTSQRLPPPPPAASASSRTGTLPAPLRRLVCAVGRGSPTPEDSMNTALDSRLHELFGRPFSHSDSSTGAESTGRAQRRPELSPPARRPAAAIAPGSDSEDEALQAHRPCWAIPVSARQQQVQARKAAPPPPSQPSPPPPARSQPAPWEAWAARSYSSSDSSSSGASARGGSYARAAPAVCQSSSEGSEGSNLPHWLKWAHNEYGSGRSSSSSSVSPSPRLGEVSCICEGSHPGLHSSPSAANRKPQREPRRRQPRRRLCRELEGVVLAAGLQGCSPAVAVLSLVFTPEAAARFNLAAPHGGAGGLTAAGLQRDGEWLIPAFAAACQAQQAAPAQRAAGIVEAGQPPGKAALPPPALAAKPLAAAGEQQALPSQARRHASLWRCLFCVASPAAKS